jgi:sodium transport system permease protein
MNPMLQVFRKEVREMFRDRRVRYAAFVGPIFIIVMLVVVLGTVMGSIGKRENQRVHVVKTSAPEVELLREQGVQVIEVDKRERGEALVKSGKARVLLNFLPKEGDQTRVEAYLDPKSQTGGIAYAVVMGIFQESNAKSLANILVAKGVPPSALEPIKVERKEVLVGEKGGASTFLVSMLPYLFVIWAFYGAMGIATDLVAGEKERNTLETLLISPIGRTQIVLGKFLALSLVSILSSFSSLVGLIIVAILKPPGTDVMFEGGFGVTPLAAAVIILIMLPLVALFCSVLIAVSSYARNSREAQTYLTLVSFVVIMPAIFSQFIGLLDVGSAFWVNYIPILNSANNIRLALLGKADAASVATTVLISVVLAAIALQITVRIFRREEVLVRT